MTHGFNLKALRDQRVPAESVGPQGSFSRVLTAALALSLSLSLPPPTPCVSLNREKPEMPALKVDRDPKEILVRG